MKLGKLIFKILVYILAQILLVLLVPLFLLLLPIYLYRYLLSKLILVFRKDLTKILPTRSQLIVSMEDDMYGSPKFPIVAMATLEGDFPPPEVEIEFKMKEVVLLKDEKGNLLRPEFQQYITSWMGFNFWKWEKDFNLANHITEYNGPRKADLYTHDDIRDIIPEILCRPFVRRSSPWEFILFRNCTMADGSTGRSVLAFHIHHAVADGFALVKSALELISSEGGGRLEPTNLTLPKVSTKEKILFSLALGFKGPYELLYTGLKLFKSLVINRNTFRTTRSQFGQVKSRFAYSKVSVDYVKEIKLSHGITFHTVLLAGITGGIRKFMIENEMKIPKSINCCIPLPPFNYPVPDKLRNCITAAFITLPVGKPDPKERLLAMGKKLRKVKSSTAPMTGFHSQPLIGGLFPWMLRLVAKSNGMLATVVSSFPGLSEPVFYGHNQAKVLDAGIAARIADKVGLVFTVLSYNGQLSVGVLVDNGLETITPIDKVLEYMHDELDLLKSMEWQDAVV